jgi:nitrogen regulatory protein P-II 1
MRLVLAVIELSRLQTLQDALAEVGVERMTVCDALNDAEESGGNPPGNRGGSAGSPARPITRSAILEIAVNEDYLERTMETIRRVASISAAGTANQARATSASICVLPLEEVVRLSDSIRGPEGVS